MEMRVTSVQQAFEEFERAHVRVANTENQAAKNVHEEFRTAVKEELGSLYADSFLAGSYRRKTQAVHLKDLDVIVVLHDPTGEFRASAKGTLSRMKQVATAYGPVDFVKVKCRAVECQLHGYTFWVDLVPALDDGHGGLLLAYNNEEEGADEWRPADPKGQTDACFKKNHETDGVYIPVTRICKFWNQSFTSSPSQEKPLPSYIVEAILYDALPGGCDWQDAVFAFFERAQQHLEMQRPSIPCPGDPQAFVDEKLEDERRVRALGKIETALAQARVAAAESDPAKAMDAWAKVFGPSFPAPSTHPSRIARALRTGSATVAGSGVSTSPLGRRPIPARSHGPGRPAS